MEGDAVVDPVADLLELTMRLFQGEEVLVALEQRMSELRLGTNKEVLDFAQKELADAGRVAVVVCFDEGAQRGGIADPHGVDELKVHQEAILADVGHELVVLIEE